jgi:methyl-accepting chemotaxis protein
MDCTIFETPPSYAEPDFLQRYCDRQQAKERRHNSVVDPKLQYSLVKSFLIVFVVASGIYYVATTFAFLQIYAVLGTVQGPEQQQIAAQIQHVEHLAAWSLGGVFGAFALFIWRAGLKLSHRITGPIFALTRHLNRVADGRTNQDLRFREDDYFSELQEAFNRHMETYRRRLSVAESVSA